MAVPEISLEKWIQNISVAIDVGPSLKLALSEGGSGENIESYLRVWFNRGHCNHLAMTWASWLLDAADH